MSRHFDLASRLQVRRALGVLLVAVLVSTAQFVAPATASAQGSIVISEVVAANSTLVDEFGSTPDWIELHNTGTAPIDLAGWTLADDGSAWGLPALTIGAGQRALVWASSRNLAGPPPHADFKLSRDGETIRLSRPDGSLADELTYPALADDQAWGVSLSGTTGYLVSPTPYAPNAALAPSIVTLATTPQAFSGSIDVTLTANLEPGAAIRYTTDGEPVTATSSTYAGPITLTQSTVLRAAVEAGGIVGQETSGGYISVAPELVNRSSDLPIVLVHSTGTVERFVDQDAIVAVIDRSGDGKAYLLGEADYTGFASMRVRGSSSANFPKKQYKFELWENLDGESRSSDLLGLGSDDDWGLYAPGRYDRSMISNPFVYELGHRIGVPAPDYQFVELWLEDDQSQAIGQGDYRGLYMLRETIEIDDERLDVVEHTPTSAGPDGSYIVRYDRTGTCCSTIRFLSGTHYGIVVDTPTPENITPGQLSWIDTWFDDFLAAMATRDFATIEQYADVDGLIDYWLLNIVSNEPDALVLSTFLHKEPGKGLSGGPLWDFDRSMGSIDPRANGLDDAVSWRNLRSARFWGDLWAVPEVQARLRARWAELRATHLADAEIVDLTNALRDEILSTYPNELTVWNDGSAYGPRFGNGLQGEIDYLQLWLQTRLDWLDGELGASTTPTLSTPGTITLDEGEAFSYDFVASNGTAFVFDHTDLPAGLSLTDDGVLSGTVAIGDATSQTVTVTVTNDTGGQATSTFDIVVSSSFMGQASVVLNEFNAVYPGGLLGDNGDDITFGRVAGNGGDWFEIVTIDDNLDLRGWQFDLHAETGTGVTQIGSLTLGIDARLADVRAGSIITVAESVPDDLSYDPRNGDWTLNLQANGTQAGALWASQADFDTNNTKWRLVVRDATGVIRAPIAGETEPWDDANLGVSGTEVMQLRADPSASIDLIVDYVDTTQSTFGAPNAWDGGTQDFSALRPTFAPLGDVSCDGVTNIVDALMIAQFTVGNRSDAPCPLPSAASQLHVSDGDINQSGSVDIVDALVISRCTVGIDDGFCPD